MGIWDFHLPQSKSSRTASGDLGAAVLPKQIHYFLVPCLGAPLGRSGNGLKEKEETMNDTEKDILIEIMRQNIVEKERYIYDLIRENLKLKGKRHTLKEEGRP